MEAAALLKDKMRALRLCGHHLTATEGPLANEDITVQPSERCWIMYELSLDALGSWASLPDIVSAAVIILTRGPGEPQCDRPVPALGPLVCFRARVLPTPPFQTPFEASPAPGGIMQERGEGSLHECVSATRLMSLSVITTQWIGPCREPCAVMRWPALLPPAPSEVDHCCFVSICYAGGEGGRWDWGLLGFEARSVDLLFAA